jgi:hypothetical protein
MQQENGSAFLDQHTHLALKVEKFGNGMGCGRKEHKTLLSIWGKRERTQSLIIMRFSLENDGESTELNAKIRRLCRCLKEVSMRT